MSVEKELAVWTHTQYMAWGRKMFWNGVAVGMSVTTLLYVLLLYPR